MAAVALSSSACSTTAALRSAQPQRISSRVLLASSLKRHVAATRSCRTSKGGACFASAAPPQSTGAHGDGNVKEIQNRADWESALSQAGNSLVVVDVATKTCGPCKFIYPKVVLLSLEYTDVTFLKVFGDLNEETRSLMREWGVRAVPMFRFYRNGELVHSHTGAKEEELRKYLEHHHKQAAVL